MRPRIALVPGWHRLLVLAVPPFLLVAAAAGWFIVRPALQPPAPAPIAADDPEGVAPPPPPGLLVDVVGAVAHPGLYRIARGERVQAAIAAAGGLTPNADPAHLPNLAALLKDGQQIRVPALRSTASPRPPPVDLNTAPLEDLEAVPGFTHELAQAVIEYRTEFGGFQSTRELVDVLGMGEAQYVLARRYLRT